MKNLLKSTRLALLCVALFIVLLVFAIVALTDMYETRNVLIALDKERAIKLANIIEKSIIVLMMENRPEDLRSLVERLPKENPELTEVRLFSPVTATIIASAERDEIGRRIYERDWDRFVSRDSSPFVIEKQGKTYASIVIPVRSRALCQRCHPSDQEFIAVMDVEVSLSGADAALSNVAEKHIVAFAIGMAAIGVIFFAGGAYLISRPLQELIQAMRRVASGDLTTRAQGFRDDEFGYLAEGFNSMVRSLQEAHGEIEAAHKEQIEKTAKLAALGEVMSYLAHEIKTPLTGISLAMQMLNTEFRGDEHKKRIICEVLQQIKRLDRTVKDVLSYARPQPPAFCTAQVDDIIKKALFLVHPEAKERGVVIETALDGSLPVVVDPDQIQQVFLNVMINAIQAMPHGGTLTIGVSASGDTEGCPPSGIAGKPPYIVVTIRDTGQGIDPTDLDHIFDPFFTKKNKGSGLGLTISRNIIHDHRGKIVVQSEIGKGTTFAIYLPTNREDMPA